MTAAFGVGAVAAVAVVVGLIQMARARGPPSGLISTVTAFMLVTTVLGEAGLGAAAMFPAAAGVLLGGAVIALAPKVWRGKSTSASGAGSSSTAPDATRGTAAGPLGLLTEEEIARAHEAFAAVRTMQAGVRRPGGPADAERLPQLRLGEEWFSADSDVLAEQLRRRGASPLQIDRILGAWAFSWLDPSTGTTVFALLEARWNVLGHIGLLDEVLDHERRHVTGGFADGLGHDDEVLALISRINAAIGAFYGARLRSARVPPQGGLPLRSLQGLTFVKDLAPGKGVAGRPAIMLMRDAEGRRWVVKRGPVGHGVAVGNVTAATAYQLQLSPADRVAGASPVRTWLTVATEPVVNHPYTERVIEVGDVVSISEFGEGPRADFRGETGADLQEQIARHYSITAVLNDWDGLLMHNLIRTLAGTLLRFDFDQAQLAEAESEWFARITPLWDPIFGRLTVDDVLAQFADRLIDQDRLLSAMPNEDFRAVVVERLEWMAEALRFGRLPEGVGRGLERAQGAAGHDTPSAPVPPGGYGPPIPRADPHGLDLVPRGVRQTVNAGQLVGLVTAGRRVWVHAERRSEPGEALWDITWDDSPQATVAAQPGGTAERKTSWLRRIFDRDHRSGGPMAAAVPGREQHRRNGPLAMVPLGLIGAGDSSGIDWGALFDVVSSPLVLAGLAGVMAVGLAVWGVLVLRARGPPADAETGAVPGPAGKVLEWLTGLFTRNGPPGGPTRRGGGEFTGRMGAKLANWVAKQYRRGETVVVPVAVRDAHGAVVGVLRLYPVRGLSAWALRKLGVDDLVAFAWVGSGERLVAVDAELLAQIQWINEVIAAARARRDYTRANTLQHMLDGWVFDLFGHENVHFDHPDARHDDHVFDGHRDGAARPARPGRRLRGVHGPDDGVPRGVEGRRDEGSAEAAGADPSRVADGGGG